METLTLNEAAKLCGRAKSTLSKALKSGKLSYISRDENTGAYSIDPAEVLRVYPEQPVNRSRDRIPTPIETRETVIQDSVLQAKVEVMEQRFADAEKTIEDLRRRLDESTEQERKLMNQLTDQRQTTPEPQKKRFFGLFGG